jgi:hypothetical protein
MRTRTSAYLALSLAFVLLATSPADALMICTGTCSSTISLTPSDPVSIGPISLPNAPPGIAGLVVPADATDFSLNVSNADVVLHVDGGLLQASDIDLRAGPLIELRSPVVLDAPNSVSFCNESFAGCVPFADPDYELSYTVPALLDIGIFGPLAGALEIFTTASLVVTADPYPYAVPEPGTALLMGLGLAWLCSMRKRRP